MKGVNVPTRRSHSFCRYLRIVRATPSLAWRPANDGTTRLCYNMHHRRFYL